MKNEITDFFKRHHFNLNPNAEKITQILLDDMKNGLRKNHQEISSMDMIPTWKNILTELPREKSVITIDAGGTNFRAALVYFDNKGKAEIVEFLKHPMPALDTEMTNIEFFDKFAEYLEPLKDKAKFISFCFSFAIKIFPDGSGEAIKLSKEIKLPELTNCKINQELHTALIRNDWKEIKKVIMVNDTASVLQAGLLEKHPNEEFDGGVGFVLGTGLNSAYIEYDKIEKIEDSPSYTIPQIIVCESGKCNKIPQSDFDKELSDKSKLPNEYFLERMCSGRYLGEICSIAIKTAMKENLFSKDTNEELKKINIFSTEGISAFLNNQSDSVFSFISKINKSDLENIYQICLAIFNRAGILASCILASACIKMNKGKEKNRPICISCDGSVFLKGFLIQETIEKHLQNILTKDRNIHFTIKTPNHPVTFGSSCFSF